MIISFYKDNVEITKEQVSPIINDNLIEFEFLDYHTIIDIETKILTRENNEFIFFLDFNKKICKITLKKENLDLDILVDDCTFKNHNNIITLEYTIETEDSKNKLIIERKNEI